MDGQTLRLPIPDLTEERRKELAKLAGQYAEKARVAVRNVRRDGMDSLKPDEKKGEIGEDERKRLENEVQNLTDSPIAAIDAKIGRASCRERGCQYVYMSVVAGSYKKKRVKRHTK